MNLRRTRNTRFQPPLKRFQAFIKFCFFILVLVGLVFLARFAFRYFETMEVRHWILQGEGGPITREWVESQTQIRKGVPILSIDLNKSVKILESNPWIDRVKISRRLPHTVIVQVVRHEPRMILNVGKLYYLDSNGKIFKELDQKDSKDFPFFSGFSRDSIEADPAIFQSVCQEAFGLLETYLKHASSKVLGISEIYYDPVSGFDLYPERASFKIVLGFDDFDSKLSRLDAALPEIQSSQIVFSEIHFNYGEAITFVEKKM